MTYVYQEFPKVKYHPKQEPRTVQNAAEEKKLGPGWVDNPKEFPTEAAALRYLRVVKPWWLEWQWLFAAIALLIAIIGGMVGLIQWHK
ncbi:MAG: hypothetical protein NVS1B11_31210 [Terriglobales bacterium]